MAIEITTENFEEVVLKNEKPVLVDFWASWCGPCKMLAPVVEEFAEQQADVVVGKIDVDQHPLLASKYGIMTIPTLMLFKDGEMVKKSIGVIPKDALVKFATE
ncbi:MAG: thioredoxin [Clostridia bacterium]|nr:thioredoxin [Clostridia bacterium]MBR2878355.1 thioredoxin [Clostridia bacterium]